VERFTHLSTPFYYYDLNLLQRTLEEVRRQLKELDWPAAQVHYAIKANHNPVLLNHIARFGFGADCVSGGEVQAALQAGFAPETIFYAGVGWMPASAASTWNRRPSWKCWPSGPPPRGKWLPSASA